MDIVYESQKQIENNPSCNVLAPSSTMSAGTSAVPFQAEENFLQTNDFESIKREVESSDQNFILLHGE